MIVVFPFENSFSFTSVYPVGLCVVRSTGNLSRIHNIYITMWPACEIMKYIPTQKYNDAQTIVGMHIRDIHLGSSTPIRICTKVSSVPSYTSHNASVT